MKHLQFLQISNQLFSQQIGAVEGQNAIKNNVTVPLSEQALVDCDASNHGCAGGSAIRAFRFLMNSTIYTDHSYPYRGHNGTCENGVDSGIKVTAFTKVLPNERSCW